MERIDDRWIKGAILVAILLVFTLPVAGIFRATAVPGQSYRAPLPPLTSAQEALAERLRGHVQAIGARPHNLAHPAELERVARHIEATLAAQGHAVHRQPFAVRGRTARNIEVVIAPARPDAETLVIGAHYDSHRDAPGANDNGSGSAAVIELARNLSDLQGKAALRIRLVLFVNEEPPYFKGNHMGSLVYARRLQSSGERIRGMISLETLGFYSDRDRSQHYPPPLDLLYPARGDFVAFVGLVSSRGFVRETVRLFRETAQFPSEGGTAPGIVQGIDWSDHWSFAQIGAPALMVTDTAPFRYPYYHTTADTPDKLDYQRLARVTSGLEQVIRRIATTP
ncbi:M28 family peptidase [Sphingomonas colocasiae]|uniref:M28 family peptidase n=1 Tax=Sphingomonas colocasiae TaxID=1848973 RepID=A0ABS7PRE9_9SPHN|nr:M28 family peptidase [Sphingomonas colocasiae]MBY8822584.1 M28 family peptidase [Sphingomonas colocasiae]